MISGQFDAVIPMLCVTLAGLVVLLAEAFRGRGERMPLGGLAIIGLVGAGIASVLLWDSGAESFGVVSADNFGLFVNLILVVVGILTVISFLGADQAWTRIAIGGLLLIFVVVQRFIVARSTRRR